MVEATGATCAGKKVKQGALRVSTAECVIEKPLLREIIQAQGYHEVENRNQKADVTFLHPMAEAANNARVLTSKGIFNKLPGVTAGKNKRKCAQVFQRMYQLYGDAFDFSPRSYVMPDDKDALRQAMQAGTQAYIFKPQASEQGQGIILAKKFKDVPAFVFAQDYVVQLYIDNPLLIEGKKFDLRIYVLISQIGAYPSKPTVAFLGEEGMVRLCTIDYAKPSQQNMHNLLQHLTNSSLNKLSDDFVSSDNLEESSTRPLSLVLEEFQRQGIDTGSMMDSIGEVCAMSLLALQPHMLYEQECIFGQVGTGQANSAASKAKGDGFQLLGFDILIDTNLKAWVLEVNENPSLDITIKRNLPSGETTKEISASDRFIKTNVVSSAIKLMTTRGRKTRASLEQVGCFKRILPSEDLDCYLADVKAKRLFEILLNGKKGSMMTLSAFSKLAKGFPGLDRTRMELLSRRIVKSGSMSLDLFFTALQELAESTLNSTYELVVDQALEYHDSGQQI